MNLEDPTPQPGQPVVDKYRVKRALGAAVWAQPSQRGVCPICAGVARARPRHRSASARFVQQRLLGPRRRVDAKQDGTMVLDTQGASGSVSPAASLSSAILITAASPSTSCRLATTNRNSPFHLSRISQRRSMGIRSDRS